MISAIGPDGRAVNGPPSSSGALRTRSEEWGTGCLPTHAVPNVHRCGTCKAAAARTASGRVRAAPRWTPAAAAPAADMHCSKQKLLQALLTGCLSS